MGHGRNVRPGPSKPKAYRVRGSDLRALMRELNRPTTLGELHAAAKEVLAHAEPIESDFL